MAANAAERVKNPPVNPINADFCLGCRGDTRVPAAGPREISGEGWAQGNLSARVPSSAAEQCCPIDSTPRCAWHHLWASRDRGRCQLHHLQVHTHTSPICAWLMGLVQAPYQRGV
eukprot:2960718-Pleurochrysis_carterae.AAC.1